MNAMKSLSPAASEALQKCRDLLRRKHYALTTEQVYCGHIGSYINWLGLHGRSFPDSRARVEAFLTAMAHRGCSASTQNQAFNALLFLYEQVRGEKLPEIQALRAKQSRHKRTALSKEQTMALLQQVPNVGGYPTQLVAWLLYGCAMRVSEPLNLRIKDIDTSAWRLTLRGCKGGKDRTVIVPLCLREGVLKQIGFAKALWQRDQASGLPVEVPGLLARKYPKAPHSWQWFWLFPAHAPCTHPRTGETVRWRMHEVNVQRSVKKAAEKLGLDGLATPHVLRHCCATHILDAGGNVRDVQDLLGHASLETTMIYVHGDGERVRSPLDALPQATNIVPFIRAA
jgi:integron integrase